MLRLFGRCLEFNISPLRQLNLEMTFQVSVHLADHLMRTTVLKINVLMSVFLRVGRFSPPIVHPKTTSELATAISDMLVRAS